MRPLLRTCLAAGVLPAAPALLAGCSTDVYLPPARLFPLESAATLPRGDTGVQVEGGVHGAGFGVSATSGTVRVRHGIDDATDASMEASVLHIEGAGPGDSYPNAFTTRIGVKHRVTPWLSVTAGVGGGASAGGGFVSPDLGVIVAYENRYFVPFLEARGGFSEPFDAQPVVVGTQPGVAPPFTWIAGGVAGFRVPLRWCDGEGQCDKPTSLLGGLGVTDFDYPGPDSPQLVFSLGGAVEFTF
ncbi:MAG TPA: hypothetical protein VGG39_37175 [Polyangiaceae bacterium]